VSEEKLEGGLDLGRADVVVVVGDDRELGFGEFVVGGAGVAEQAEHVAVAGEHRRRGGDGP
jgi:hypothetical protein